MEQFFAISQQRKGKNKMIHLNPQVFCDAKRSSSREHSSGVGDGKDEHGRPFLSECKFSQIL